VARKAAKLLDGKKGWIVKVRRKKRKRMMDEADLKEAMMAVEKRMGEMERPTAAEATTLERFVLLPAADVEKLGLEGRQYQVVFRVGNDDVRR